MRIFAVWILALLAASVRGQDPLPPLPPDGITLDEFRGGSDRWRRSEGSDYDLLTDIDPDPAKSLVGELQALETEAPPRLGLPPAPPGLPKIAVGVFREKERYVQALNRLGRTHYGGLPYVDHVGHFLLAWAGERTEEDVLRAVRHEFAHQIVQRRVIGRPFRNFVEIPYPKAYEEGIAEFLECVRVRDGRIDWSPVHPALAERVRRQVEAGRLTPVREVLGLGPDAYRSELGRRQAESWALFYHFVNSPDDRMRSILAGLAAGLPRADPADPDRGKAFAGILAAAGVTGDRFEADRLAFFRSRFGIAPASPDDLRVLHEAVAALGSDSYEARQGATDRLGKFGAAAAPVLQEALRSGDPEVRSRAGALLDELRAVPRFFHWWSGVSDPPATTAK